MSGDAVAFLTKVVSDLVARHSCSIAEAWTTTLDDARSGMTRVTPCG